MRLGFKVCIDNLTWLVLKARHLGGSALFFYRSEVPEQALGGIPLGFGGLCYAR